MRSNRRNRGGQPHQNNQSSGNRSSDASSNSRGSVIHTALKFDLNQVLQEADGGYQITWREVVFILCFMVFFTAISILIGSAAGMTISIHYHESQLPTAVRRMDQKDTSAMYSGAAAHKKVTTLDPHIASMNVLQHKDRDGLDLGKVITTSASGQLNVLMVVEEVTPLHVDGGKQKSTAPNNGNEPLSRTHSSFWHVEDNAEDHLPLTTHQANLLVPGFTQWKENQPSIVMREPTILPSTCPDRHTVGFDDWHTLKAAVQEANSISAERFMKWSSYFASVGKDFGAFEDDNLYYEEDVVFTICPRTTLKARRGPIHINAENVVIECEDCVIDVKGTHLNFGPHAKNVLVRGVTFKGAHSSSLTFFHDGAEASFEDCFWIGNTGLSSKYGAVADVNSTSFVNFYRCEISQGNQISALGTGPPGMASSLSIRV